jgi:hypothetical protein
MFSSSSSINFLQLKKGFFDKVPKGIALDSPNAINCEEKILFWIKDNVEKTQFTDYQEAETTWRQFMEARNIVAKENPEIYKSINFLRDNCSEQFGEIFIDLMHIYGDDFYL